MKTPVIALTGFYRLINPVSLTLLCLVAVLRPGVAQSISLRDSLETENGMAMGRKLTFYQDGDRTVAYFAAGPGATDALIKGVVMRTGVIEVDFQGRNEFQKSFLGIVFNLTTNQVHEVIYFRPFNFGSADPSRRGHAVQYVALPDHDWSRLRQEFPQKYENGVTPTPKPDDWFRARIEIDEKEVRVFVNGARTPSLGVQRLVKATSASVGLFVE